MAKFCTRCGKPLQEGEICSCSANSTPMPKIDTTSAKGFLESMKNRMGIGDPELNKDDAFEKGKQIIPDCVRSNESEIPVKQYTVATLRNRILCIPYTKAIGRMQVTNKRVIFRAPGRCLSGRTTLQHEFAIDEIAGLEARREYVFNFWDLLIGIIVMLISGCIITALINSMTTSNRYEVNIAGPVILSILFGIAGCIPFFMLKKKWLLKLLCEGCSCIPLLSVGLTISAFSGYIGGAGFWGGFLVFLGIISLLIALFTLIVYCIRPNLVLLIKTKSANEAIDIKRKKTGLFASKADNQDHTGYKEVLPADDAEKCIREINAMINDIQKLGDFGIEKWKK